MKFFIINLAPSIDRRERMQKSIDKWRTLNPNLARDFSFEFFKASTPEDIKASGFINRYDRFLAWVWKAREVRDTELACFASHYGLWEKCVELNEPIFILEDDLDINCNFGSGAMDIASSPYEYVRFCWSTFRRMLLVNDRFAFGHPLILGAGGYYIKPGAAKKLIKGAHRIYIALDYYLSHSYLHGVVEMVYMRPLVVLNELDSNSTIGKPEHVVRSDEDKARYKKFVALRELHRIYRQFRTACFALSRIFNIKSKW